MRFYDFINFELGTFTDRKAFNESMKTFILSPTLSSFTQAILRNTATAKKIKGQIDLLLKSYWLALTESPQYKAVDNHRKHFVAASKQMFPESEESTSRIEETILKPMAIKLGARDTDCRAIEW